MGAKSRLDPLVMVDVFNAGPGVITAGRDAFLRPILPRTFEYRLTERAAGVTVDGSKVRE